MQDALGDRMKSFYEDRTRISLPRKTYTIIRIDGKAFHTFTRGLRKPFDVDLIEDMDETTRFLCSNIQGVKLGYVQSDEISLILTDFDKITSDAWFDGNIQKIVSISASLATAKFNQLRLQRELTNSWRSYVYGRGQEKDPITWDFDFSVDLEKVKLAQFDSRVFTISQREEVLNYLIWRQNDATRNSISMVAQSMYSHNELNGKTTDDMQEMIFQKGVNWNSFAIGQRRGRVIIKNYTLVESTKENYNRANDKTDWVLTGDENNPTYNVTRSVWSTFDPPIFSKNKEFFKNIIPDYYRD